MGLKTLAEVAQEIGTSDTSIIRFVRSMGFRGYADFKKAMNERMMQQYIQRNTPSEKYFDTRSTLGKGTLTLDVMDQVMKNLHKTLDQLDPADIDTAADILLTSKRKYIVGFRSTSCCVAYMSKKLIYLIPDVIPCTFHDSTLLEKIIDISADDCILLFSFPRYTKINRTLLAIAKEKGAKTIVITDSITNPLSDYADLLITAAVDGIGFSNSYIAPMYISEAILLTISNRTDSRIDQRISELDDYLATYELY